jgi:exopolyphosphatase/guanosine-5'-triphosphate,3'-diphosphate pyrophosphatase
MRIAILDLGTNTFNLLTVEITDNKEYKILCRSEVPVKLGKGGIDKKELRPDAMTRGINALEKHLKTASEFKAEKFIACATSAIRTARNSDHFIKSIRERYGIDVEIVSGDREAELIYRGILLTAVLTQEKCLILDIGGGSNELIIGNAEKIFWKKSYPLGMARLIEKFRPSDPITIEEIEFISNYLEERMPDFFEEFRKHRITTLIGVSGSFDTFTAMIREEDSGPGMKEKSMQSVTEIDLADFENLYQHLINSTLKERKQMKGLEAHRLDTIVPASMLVKFLMGKLKLQHIIHSNFALKEGILYELLHNKDYDKL